MKDTGDIESSVRSSDPHRASRREFLRLSGSGAAGAVAATATTIIAPERASAAGSQTPQFLPLSGGTMTGTIDFQATNASTFLQADVPAGTYQHIWQSATGSSFTGPAVLTLTNAGAFTAGGQSVYDPVIRLGFNNAGDPDPTKASWGMSIEGDYWRDAGQGPTHNVEWHLTYTKPNPGGYSLRMMSFQYDAGAEVATAYWSLDSFAAFQAATRSLVFQYTPTTGLDFRRQISVLTSPTSPGGAAQLSLRHDGSTADVGITAGGGANGDTYLRLNRGSSNEWMVLASAGGGNVTHSNNVYVLDLVGGSVTTRRDLVIRESIDDGDTFAERLRFPVGGGIQLPDNANLIVGTSAGTRIGTATTQRLGFWNVPPVAQQVLATGAGHSVDDVIALLQMIGLCRQVS